MNVWAFWLVTSSLHKNTNDGEPATFPMAPMRTGNTAAVSQPCIGLDRQWHSKFTSVRDEETLPSFSARITDDCTRSSGKVKPASGTEEELN